MPLLPTGIGKWFMNNFEQELSAFTYLASSARLLLPLLVRLARRTLVIQWAQSRYCRHFRVVWCFSNILMSCSAIFGPPCTPRLIGGQSRTLLHMSLLPCCVALHRYEYLNVYFFHWCAAPAACFSGKRTVLGRKLFPSGVISLLMQSLYKKIKYEKFCIKLINTLIL